MDRRSEHARVFVVLELGGAPRALAEESLAHLHTALRGQPSLRFTRPPDLHVTLAFLGELAFDRLSPLHELVAALARDHAPITAEVGGLGAFPRTEAAHVLWLGFGSRSTALTALVSDLQARLRAAGHALESRAWQGHVTLARCRSRAGLDARAALAAGPDRRVTTRVDALVVMESRPKPDGSRYTPIFRALLSGAMKHERV